MQRIPRKRVSTVARQSNSSESLVRWYCDQGLLECEFDSNGGRLLYDDAPERIRELRSRERKPRSA